MSYHVGNGRHYNHYGNKGISKLRFNQQKLPVFKYKEQILSAIKHNVITLIVGETGSGKTTQIPQYLLEWNQITPSSRIVCTQPRTIAATSVALRVSEEQQCELGTTVGFHIRLDRKMTEGVTRLEYMTEGVLLRKAMNTKFLSDYKVVIIDEAHERTVNADLLMGFLKEIVSQNQANKQHDLRLIIMSATLDTRRFTKYFDDPPVISIPGSLHPIEHHWLNEATDDYIKLTIDCIMSIHCDVRAFDQEHYRPDGHILVFLTGQQEIDNVVRIIKNRRCLNPYYQFPLEVHPLYASLNNKDRQKAFDEPMNPMSRKCVIATNIAETSLTISNVVYVIDCGLSKQKVYSPSEGVEALGIRGISKASVKQRIGRAGRVRPGTAFHLYTQSGYNQFPNETKAEILRSGLVSETLSMLALGITNPLQFDFIDAPDEMTMARAINVLYHLGAVDDKGKITSIGHQMSKFPVNPRMAKCLLMADHYHCVYEMVVIAAMLEIAEKLWRRPKDEQKSDFRLKKKTFYHVSGDHLTLLNIYNAYKQKKKGNRTEMRQFCMSHYLDYCSLDRADQIRSQLEYILMQMKIKENVLKLRNGKQSNPRFGQDGLFMLNDHQYIGYYDDIIKCLLTGYFMNVAVQGFGEKYWTFRLLTLNENADGTKTKAVEIINKATCHPTSIFFKGDGRNWVMFHQIQISHTTQLRMLTAIQPVWLMETCPHYYDIKSLEHDRSPIAKVLIASNPQSL